MIFIMIQDTLYVAGRQTVDENPTVWFLIFVRSTGGSVAVNVIGT